MLWQKDLPGANLVVRGARVLDPVEGIDARLEVRIDDGTIAEIAEKVDTNEHRVVEADGLVLAPAFVDPHDFSLAADANAFSEGDFGREDQGEFDA